MLITCIASHTELVHGLCTTEERSEAADYKRLGMRVHVLCLSAYTYLNSEVEDPAVTMATNQTALYTGMHVSLALYMQGILRLSDCRR